VEDEENSTLLIKTLSLFKNSLSSKTLSLSFPAARRSNSNSNNKGNNNK